MSDLGQRLFAYRTADKRSWGYIARKIGVSRMILWRIISGAGCISQKNIADVEAFLVRVTQPVTSLATAEARKVTELVTQPKRTPPNKRSPEERDLAIRLYATLGSQEKVAEEITRQTGKPITQRSISNYLKAHRADCGTCNACLVYKEKYA